ncbi:hypothetical protein KJ359_007441 [Pestalotiopsis sp. 9143b]|nr:hypothetical protein KJ359_007441 [Pestalotiopsis sp. 9143b]
MYVLNSAFTLGTRNDRYFDTRPDSNASMPGPETPRASARRRRTSEAAGLNGSANSKTNTNGHKRSKYEVIEAMIRSKRAEKRVQAQSDTLEKLQKELKDLKTRYNALDDPLYALRQIATTIEGMILDATKVGQHIPATVIKLEEARNTVEDEMEDIQTKVDALDERISLAERFIKQAEEKLDQAQKDYIRFSEEEKQMS